MKNFAYFFILMIIIAIGSCKKGNVDTADAKLIGNWKVVSNFISIGGPGEWHDLSPDKNINLEFKVDGTLKGDDLASYYATYAVKDSVTLTLTKKNSDITQNYTYKIDGNFLTLSPAGPIMCIEGCATKYIKQ